MPLSDNDRKCLTCDPSDYIYKYTISSTENSWRMVYHFEEIKLDLVIKVYHLDHSRASKVFEHIRHLTNLRSEFILSPEKVFNWCGELWLIFPLYIGRQLNEVITRHFVNGLPNERITARVLLDVLEALEALHEAKLCHRALATYNLFIEKETGKTRLKDFTNVKFFEEDDKAKLRATMWKTDLEKSHLMPPEMLGMETGEVDVDERKADIFLFAVTAMNLAYGSVPRSPLYQGKGLGVMRPTDWVPPSTKSYQHQPEHISDAFRAMLAPCLEKLTKKRPSAKELMKDKFFNRAASRAEVKEQVCSLLKIAEPTCINDVPPSQSDNSTTAPHSTKDWDFTSVNRVPSDFKMSERACTIPEDSESYLTLEEGDEKSRVKPLTLDSPNADVAKPCVTQLDIDGSVKPRANDKRFNDALPKAKQKTSKFHVVETEAALSINETRNHCNQSVGKKQPVNLQSQPVSQKPKPAKKQQSRFTVDDLPFDVKTQPPATQEPSAQVPAWTTKNPLAWEIDDVCAWLHSLGGIFKGYTTNFSEAGIDGDMLCSMTDDELKELEVTKQIHRRRILTSIKKLNWS